MASQDYKVKAPDGRILTVRGPAGATQEQVIEQAKKLYAQKPEFSVEEGPERLAKPLSSLDVAKMQSTLSSESAGSTAGAIGKGFIRGMENVGQGVLERGTELAGALGFDTGDFRDKLKASGDIEAQKFSATSEERPIAAGVGEIAGSLAAIPYAPASIPKAAAVGAAMGAFQPADDGADLAGKMITGAAIGGISAAAAPYIQKGFSKAQSLLGGLLKKSANIDPRPDMFTPDGGISDIGRKAMTDLGITEDDFARIYAQTDQNLDPIQAMRVERAKEQGIPLTTAQARQDFASQEAEQSLLGGIGRESESARGIASGQQDAIRAAQEKFERGFGELADKDARGAAAREGLAEAKDIGSKKVGELYTAASKIEGEAIPLDNAGLLDVIDEQMMRPVDDKVIGSIESLMAKYGMIGGVPEQSGRFYQVADESGRSVRFRGEQTPLSLTNAEQFRQGLNQILPADQSGAVKQIIRALDDQVGSAVGKMPAGSERTAAFQTARAAAREQKETFHAKDIVQKLTSFKTGTKTPMVDPDRVIDSVLKGANARGDLRRVKDVLMKDATGKSVDAWRSIQAQGAADIFGQSINPVTGDVSGARLATAIKKFGGGSQKEGENRLKVLFGEKYGDFDNLVKAIGDATIPLKGTTNPSGTAYKMINFMTRVGSVGQFGADAIIPLYNKAKDSAVARRTLKNMATASPEKVKQAIKANDEMIDTYIRLGLTGSLRDGEDR